MLILGINAYHAEASAALLKDGNLVAAAEEERFCRIKHVAGFPTRAVRFCLAQAGVRLEQIDAIAVSRNPRCHLLAKGFSALRGGLSARQFQDRLINWNRILDIRSPLAEAAGADPRRLKTPLHFVEHHRAHIASSFYASGWDRSVVLSLDGFGDFMSALWGTGDGLELRIHGGVAFPHSLGILYTAVTQFLGFPRWGDEYKVMGLAAQGRPDPFRQALSTLVRPDRRRGYRLNLRYFAHVRRPTPMTWAQGAPHLGWLFTPAIENLIGPPRPPDAPLEPRHADLAAALQERLEEVILPLLRNLHRTYGGSRLCYAGGVALNCSLNGKIRGQTPFQEIFIQPAAHDAGTSLGAALYAAHHIYRLPRAFRMTHAAWGPESSEESCRQALEKAGFTGKKLRPQELVSTAAEALASGKIIGWHQGRMEFGPRALGHRSLLADPRDPTMKARINERIKRRETFRPFAPSILSEAVGDYFPAGHPDRFMLFAYPVCPSQRGRIPAVVHVDGTGRLQAVSREDEPLYWELLKSFETRTGVPVLLNTSFNEQEPIVCRPEEAVDCARRNSVDCLALGPFWLDLHGAS